MEQVDKLLDTDPDVDTELGNYLELLAVLVEEYESRTIYNHEKSKR